MAGKIRVNTDQVSAIAADIERQNENLLELLQRSQNVIENLKNTWEGEAANATIDAYKNFAGKYFNNYHDVIAKYVQFLRSNVEAGYTETEQVNTQLADAFE